MSDQQSTLHVHSGVPHLAYNVCLRFVLLGVQGLRLELRPQRLASDHMPDPDDCTAALYCHYGSRGKEYRRCWPDFTDNRYVWKRNRTEP
jgi:hypothetical protein